MASQPTPTKVHPKVEGANRKPRPRRKELEMRKLFEIGGVAAAAVLIAFGIAALVMVSTGVVPSTAASSRSRSRARRT
jgi:hypothetical protein